MSGYTTPSDMKRRIDALESALKDMIDVFELPASIKNRHPDLRHSTYNVQLAVLDSAKRVLGEPQRSSFDTRSAITIMDSDRQAEIATKRL